MMPKDAESQWYIARDGQQHGPLTEAEMRTFVEMHHLKQTDLVWRPGFADWRPAPHVFPVQAQTEPAVLLDDNAPTFEAAQQPSPQTEGPAESASETSADAVPQALDEAGPFLDNDDLDISSPASDKRRQSAPGPLWIVAAALAVIGLGGGLWLALARGPGLFRAASLHRADTAEPIAEKAPAPQEVSTADTWKALDARFQRLPIWAAVKREFPEWYGEQLDESVKLAGGPEPDAAITRRLLEGLVVLRRKHADEALAAPMPRLRGIASTFLGNLKALQAKKTGACYSFISQGEASPVIIELLQEPDESRPVQDHVIAIIDAIAEGRRSPVTHQAPTKADYVALANGLAQIGWRQADLALFNDATALAQAPPERVCQMVQDWFAALMSIKDESTQERLLVDTLRPVVAG